jgi:chromatin remodeling complex protein RSC6
MVKQSSKSSTPAVQTATATAATPVVEKVAKAPKAEKAAASTSAATPVVTEKVAKAPKAEKAAASTSAAAPVVAEKVAKAPKAEKAVAKAPKAAAAPAVAPVAAAVDTAVVASGEAAVSVSSEFTDFMAKLQQLSATISSLKTEFRSLEKKASRELKTAAKASHKRKRKTGNRSPSGFVKPTLISDELATFLGKTSGTEMARTEVTREINAYIRANQLQDTTNGRRINADTKLSSLLKLASGEELTYFNLQRYMSPHFAKTAAAVVASA